MPTFIVKRAPMKTKKDFVRHKFDEIFGYGTTKRVSFMIKRDQNNFVYKMFFVKVSSNSLVDDFIQNKLSKGIVRIDAKPIWKIDIVMPTLIPFVDNSESDDDWVELD
jgi:hypothetical protein